MEMASIWCLLWPSSFPMIAGWLTIFGSTSSMVWRKPIKMMCSGLPFHAFVILQPPTASKFQIRSIRSSTKSSNSTKYLWWYSGQLHFQRLKTRRIDVHRITFLAMRRHLLQTCQNSHEFALRLMWRRPLHYRLKLRIVIAGSHHWDWNVHHARYKWSPIRGRCAWLHALHRRVHSANDWQI